MPRATRQPRRLLAILTAAFVGALAVGCGGDEESSGPSAASLEKLLLPANQLPPLHLERTLDWDNATDFAVQGTVLPQGTAPSAAIAKIEDDGFASGAGDILMPQGGGSPVHLSIASFDSEDGAREAQRYLHGQDLQQPCFAACAVSPKELPLDQIPGAAAVHQVPVEGPLPPGLEPFEAYAAEFTIGSDLFYVWAGADPGDIPVAVFEKGVQRFHDYAAAQLH